MSLADGEREAKTLLANSLDGGGATRFVYEQATRCSAFIEMATASFSGTGRRVISKAAVGRDLQTKQILICGSYHR